MHRSLTHKHRWGVILAGGEGVRLRSLTRLVSGDDRPKQFCPLLGGRTLLNQTRRRIQRSISQLPQEWHSEKLPPSRVHNKLALGVGNMERATWMPNKRCQPTSGNS
jgi:hypothetical protein